MRSDGPESTGPPGLARPGALQRAHAAQHALKPGYPLHYAAVLTLYVVVEDGQPVVLGVRNGAAFLRGGASYHVKSRFQASQGDRGSLIQASGYFAKHGAVFLTLVPGDRRIPLS